MAKKVSCIIIDDEQSNISSLKSRLLQYEDVNVLDTISDPTRAVSSVLHHKPDILFVDIQMPKMGGFELLEALHRENYEGSEIIFITEYDAFATKAFEYAAFDYLIKPIDTSRLRVSLDKFRTGIPMSLQERTQKLLATLTEKVFPTKRGMIVIEPIDIVYCEADEETTYLYFKNRRQEIILQPLDEMEKTLRSDLFVRISDEVMINIKALSKIEISKNLCHLSMDGQNIKLHIDPDKIDRLSVWR